MHFAIGDVHGCLDALVQLLQREGFIGPALEWTGGQAQLWFLGDYTDRGPDGIGVIELLMRLEAEAQAAGGGVQALLGNHDVLLLAAHRFCQLELPRSRREGYRVTFYELWQDQGVGGRVHDFKRLSPAHLAWLARRPALAQVGDTLLMHADSLFYLEWGKSLEQINQNLLELLHTDNLEAWEQLIDGFADRLAFLRGGLSLSKAFLEQMGACRLVHGHTPIFALVGCPPEEVRGPLEYNQGLCYNIDPALWKKGPGFVFPLAYTG
ncbi:metallophosphoesterase [Meiothermus rufus]|uniref:metallophosphoesterase n=1 Tax=Meiothermus rufus TaxID=604332 RepID=UPI00041BFD84|nr:metallophosphoesterase [Meiothermus rufus]